MATTRVVLNVASAVRVPSVTFPEFKQAGTNITVSSYSFDAASTEAVMWVVPYLQAYGSGNITCKIRWHPDTATTGNVVWGVQIAALTPETDTQDVETDSWATQQTVTDGALGTTAQRVHEASVAISNLDSVASGDYFAIRVDRLGANGSDTMAGDAQLVGVVLEYSDTP